MKAGLSGLKLPIGIFSAARSCYKRGISDGLCVYNSETFPARSSGVAIMPEDWKQWVGQVVHGEFPLLQYLGGSKHSCVFLTERREAEQTVKAAVKLLPATGEGDEARLLRWHQAAALSHPHLIRLYESGRCEVFNVPMLYVVMEFAEENLAEVLSDRALTPEETRSMMEPILSAIEFLNVKGLTHGHLKPSNIMAIGDQLKLSSDEICRAGEPGSDPGRPDAYDPPEYSLGNTPATRANSPAGDVWSLGMMLVEALTQKLPDVLAMADKPRAPEALPDPFFDIVQHCLVWDPNGRWTIAKIAARLRSPAPLPEKPVSVPRSEPAEPPPIPVMKLLAYGIPLIAAVLLVAALVVSKLLSPHSVATQVPAAAIEQPVGQTAEMQQPDERSIPALPPKAAAAPSRALESEENTQTAAVPAIVHSENSAEGETIAKMELPAATTTRGAVLQKVMPEVLQSAEDTIQGTIRVTVKLDVDRDGNVENADLVSPGVSKYFARQALQAAQRWKFQPPKVGGGNVLSTWSLRFEFKREGTTVIPTQESP
jgi:TonB family protein